MLSITLLDNHMRGGEPSRSGAIPCGQKLQQSHSKVSLNYSSIYGVEIHFFVFENNCFVP